MYISSDGSTMKGAEEEYGYTFTSFNETEGENFGYFIYLGLFELSFFFMIIFKSKLVVYENFNFKIFGFMQKKMTKNARKH